MIKDNKVLRNISIIISFSKIGPPGFDFANIVKICTIDNIIKHAVN